MRKEFFVMGDEACVGGEEPYIFKLMVDVYINKLAPLADPENKLVFRVSMWCWDAEEDRKKRIAGVRYYPLQKKLTKITDKVEKPFKVYNQKEVFITLDKIVQEILAAPDFKEEVKDTIVSYCKKCKKDKWICRCNEPKETEVEPTWVKS